MDKKNAASISVNTAIVIVFIRCFSYCLTNILTAKVQMDVGYYVSPCNVSRM